MNPLTCFIISPIGDKDSEIRKNADDLLELIIEPAIDKYGFKLVRADKLSTVSSITNDIIHHVQNSDLCVIDLTGQNSNVMYELGRRHESMKPFILLAKDGEKLPFDINTIRTIFYNIESPREIRETIKTIQGFIGKLIEEGFAPKSSGETLTSISESLKRIERKIESLKHISPMQTNMSEMPEIDILKSLTPKEAFSLSLRENNLGMAEKLLPLIKERTSSDNFFDNYIEPLAAKGSMLAKEIIENEFDYVYSLPIKRQIEAVGSLVNCYSIHDREEEGIVFLEKYFMQLGENEIDKTSLSLILNQKQRLLHGVRDYEKAIEIGKNIIGLNPAEPSFYYNQCMNYLASKDIDNAALMIEQCLSVSKDVIDDNHIAKAIDIYRLKNDRKKVETLMEQLKSTNPLKYRLKLTE